MACMVGGCRAVQYRCVALLDAFLIFSGSRAIRGTKLGRIMGSVLKYKREKFGADRGRGSFAICEMLGRPEF